MNTVQALAGKQEIVLPDVPNDVAGIIRDATVWRRRDKSSLLFVEVALILERKAVSQRFLVRDCVVGWRFGLSTVLGTRFLDAGTDAGYGQNRCSALNEFPEHDESPVWLPGIVRQ